VRESSESSVLSMASHCADCDDFTYMPELCLMLAVATLARFGKKFADALAGSGGESVGLGTRLDFNGN